MSSLPRILLWSVQFTEVVGIAAKEKAAAVSLWDEGCPRRSTFNQPTAA